jgi:hypothetical protein
MRSTQFETTEEGAVRRQMALEPIPNVEWWDEALLETDSYDSGVKVATSDTLCVPFS